MNKLLVCFALVAAVNFASGTHHGIAHWFEDSDSKPWFCKSYPCPGFRVVDTYEGYELREYSDMVWVKAKFPEMESEYWEKLSHTGDLFWKLFGYINGENDQSLKMNMTVPVVMKHNRQSVWMAFVLPEEFRGTPPSPLKPDVEIYNMDKFQVYVKGFGGFPYGPFEAMGWGMWNRFKPVYNELRKELDTAGHSYKTGRFFTAGYNSPYEIFNRHNEVWIEKK